MLSHNMQITDLIDRNSHHNLLQYPEIICLVMVPEVSDATKQSLLELISYYNNQDPLEEDWIEERWFRQGVRIKERKRNLWK